MRVDQFKTHLNKHNFISTISELADQHDAINLAIQLSELPCPKELIELVNKYMQQGFNNDSPSEGIEPLRKQIAARIKRLYKREYDYSEEVTIVPGSAHGMSTAISATIKEGDEVIIFEPVSEFYVSAIELAGGRPIFVTLKQPDFHIDWDEVKKSITSKTRMMIINNPHKSTGMVFNEEDVNKLLRIINGTRIILLSSEVFEHIVFDEEKHHSMASFPALAERSLIVSSFGPVYKINGWGIGYIVGPQKLMKEFRRVQKFQGYSVNTPAQYALAEFMEDDIIYEDMSDYYQGKRNYFNRLLKDSNFEVVPSKGSYFEILDYSKISNESDIDFASRLIKEYGVATVPLSIFQHDKSKHKMIRVCFAKPNEVLELAAERLKSVATLTESS
jgi:methionine aminotransferase